MVPTPRDQPPIAAVAAAVGEVSSEDDGVDAIGIHRQGARLELSGDGLHHLLVRQGDSAGGGHVHHTLHEVSHTVQVGSLAIDDGVVGREDREELGATEVCREVVYQSRCLLRGGGAEISEVDVVEVGTHQDRTASVTDV